MSWFPINTNVVSLLLTDTHSTDGTIVIDIFPSRWTHTHSIEDAMLSFVAKFLKICSKTENGMWWNHDLHLTALTGYMCDDFAFGPGGYIAHNGVPVAPTIAFLLDGRHLTLPDGNCVLVQPFRQGAQNAFNTTQGPQHRQNLKNLLTGCPEDTTNTYITHVMAAFFLGAAQAFVESSQATNMRMAAQYGGKMLAATAARTLRHLNACPRSGQDATDWLYKTNLFNATMLFHSWAVRPDRGWMPNRWVLGTFFQTLHELCTDPDALAAGYAAGTKFFASGIDYSTLLADNPTSTAHDKLTARKARADIENAALLAFAHVPGRLKPMAAKRVATLTKTG